MLPTTVGMAEATHGAVGVKTAFTVGWSSDTISISLTATTDMFRGWRALLRPLLLLLLLLDFLFRALAGSLRPLGLPRRAGMSLAGWTGTA